MTLYFYYLEGANITVEKKEAEEKPKTYRVKRNYSYDVYRKEDEWVVKNGFYSKEIFSHEYNLEKAKEIFIDEMKGEIKAKKWEIENVQERIAELEKTIEILETP